MQCTICKANKIGPDRRPFGGFLCSNEHLQCYECNAKTSGHCLHCSAATKFLQMKFDSPRPSEPYLNFQISQKISDEIETQSRLSQEYLGMNCSAESFKQTAQHNTTCDQEATGLTPAESSISFNGVLDDSNTLKCPNTADIAKAKAEKLSVSPEGHEGLKNKNLFLLKANATDSIDLIEKSEDFEASTSSCYQVEQLKCLSVEVLQDFDSQNFNSKNEGVNNYLKSCSPTEFHASPAFNCEHADCHFGVEPRQQKLEMKSISISTESDPSLKSTYLQTPANIDVGKFCPQDYFILQAMEVTPASQVGHLISNKSQNLPILDVRMQKVLETLKEDVRINAFAEKSCLTKMPTQVSTKEQEEKWSAKVSCSKEEKNSDSIDQLSNTYRAHYNFSPPYAPPANDLHILCKARPVQQEPPSPQFERVPCSNALAQELLLKQAGLSNIKTIPANLLHIPRTPILCPESTCQRMIFVSDFNKHLVVDHNHLPMERINPFQCKSFFLDARLFKNGASRCHLLYLMCDKIVGLGSTEYKDFLPILVMTSRISLSQICDLRNQESSAADYFLIWVTGIVPDELSISCTLTVWSRAGTTAPSCHIVYSGQVYSIRNSQLAFDVLQSGRTLLLSSQEVAALTSNGKEMLNLQLSVH